MSAHSRYRSVVFFLFFLCFLSRLCLQKCCVLLQRLDFGYGRSDRRFWCTFCAVLCCLDDFFLSLRLYVLFFHILLRCALVSLIFGFPTDQPHNVNTATMGFSGLCLFLADGRVEKKEGADTMDNDS